MVSGTMVRFLSALPPLALPETTAERTAMIASKASTWLKNKQLPESPDTGRESYCTVLRIGGLQGDPARPLVPTAGVAAGVRRGGGPLPPHHQVLEVGIHRAIPAQDGEFSKK